MQQCKWKPPISNLLYKYSSRSFALLSKAPLIRTRYLDLYRAIWMCALSTVYSRRSPLQYRMMRFSWQFLIHRQQMGRTRSNSSPSNLSIDLSALLLDQIVQDTSTDRGRWPSSMVPQALPFPTTTRGWLWRTLQTMRSVV